MRARLTLILTIAAALLGTLFVLPTQAAPTSSRGSWFAAAANTVDQQVQVVSRLRAEERARLAHVAALLTTPPPAPPPPPSPDDPTTFLYPADGPITSTYKWRWGRMHTGVDIDAAYGATIVAAQAGTVTLAGWKNGYGQTVIIDHGNGISTLYAHQSKLYVSDGQRVERGDSLGAVGATGNVTAAHLHYEVLVGGAPRNPAPWL